MKEPRHTLVINDLTYNAFLGLLWAIDGTFGNRAVEKTTIRQVEKQHDEFKKVYDNWRAANFKCARGLNEKTTKS